MPETRRLKQTPRAGPAALGLAGAALPPHRALPCTAVPVSQRVALPTEEGATSRGTCHGALAPVGHLPTRVPGPQCPGPPVWSRSTARPVSRVLETPPPPCVPARPVSPAPETPPPALPVSPARVAAPGGTEAASPRGRPQRGCARGREDRPARGAGAARPQGSRARADAGRAAAARCHSCWLTCSADTARGRRAGPAHHRGRPERGRRSCAPRRLAGGARRPGLERGHAAAGAGGDAQEASALLATRRAPAPRCPARLAGQEGRGGTASRPLGPPSEPPTTPGARWWAEPRRARPGAWLPGRPAPARHLRFRVPPGGGPAGCGVLGGGVAAGPEAEF